jgi:hypothetical protein
LFSIITKYIHFFQIQKLENKLALVRKNFSRQERTTMHCRLDISMAEGRRRMPGGRRRRPERRQRRRPGGRRWWWPRGPMRACTWRK